MPGDSKPTSTEVMLLCQKVQGISDRFDKFDTKNDTVHSQIVMKIDALAEVRQQDHERLLLLDQGGSKAMVELKEKVEILDKDVQRIRTDIEVARAKSIRRSAVTGGGVAVVITTVWQVLKSIFGIGNGG